MCRKVAEQLVGRATAVPSAPSGSIPPALFYPSGLCTIPKLFLNFSDSEPQHSDKLAHASFDVEQPSHSTSIGRKNLIRDGQDTRFFYKKLVYKKVVLSCSKS